MKLETSQAETSGNLVFKKKIAMRLDDSARALIIKSIIDMYSNPYVAVLREYTSNAYDSHVWAGQSRPVEVTLPTRLQPNLIVQDWGIGLSAAELEDYAQFGTSTKRDTNDQIGGFGFGSKSGLAVCSRFTVESVKDGKRSVVVIGRDADGPQMGLLIEDEDTDLPNGLKVTIPTTEAYKFEQALERNFFIGYPVGSILVNGKAPTLSVHAPDVFSALDAYGWLNVKPGTWQGNDYYQGSAMVGPVRYSVDYNSAGIQDRSAMQGILKEVIFKLDNGSVDLTPSREALIYSARTRRHIQERVTDALGVAKVRYAEQIEKAPTLRDAMRLMLKAEQYGIRGDFSWNGKKIEMTKVADDVMNSKFTVVDATAGGPSGVQSSRSQWNGMNVLNNFHFLSSKALGDKHSVLVVECEPMDAMGKNRYEHKIALTNTTFVRALGVQESARPIDFTVTYTERKFDEFPEAFQAAFTHVMTAEESKALVSEYRKATRAAAVKAPKAPKRDQDIVSVLGTFREGYSFTNDMKIADLDKNKKYILLKNMSGGLEEKVRRAMLLKVGQEEYGRDLNDIIRAVANDGGYGFIFANKTWNTDDYVNYVSFVTFEDAAQAVYKKAASGLTPVQRLAGTQRMAYSYTWATTIGASYIADIKRDELREFLIALADKSIVQRLALIEGMSKSTIQGVKLEAAFKGQSLPHDPVTDYPLLAHVGQIRGHDGVDVVDYINMIDEAKGRI